MTEKLIATVLGLAGLAFFCFVIWILAVLLWGAYFEPGFNEPPRLPGVLRERPGPRTEFVDSIISPEFAMTAVVPLQSQETI